MFGWWGRRGRFAKILLGGSLAFAAAMLGLAATVAVERSRVAAIDAKLRGISKDARLEECPTETPRWHRQAAAWSPTAAEWLRVLLPMRYRVVAEGCGLTNDDARLLVPRSLSFLYLPNNPALTDAGFAGIADARELVQVDFAEARGIGDATVVPLARAHRTTLWTVNLAGTGVGDASLAAFAHAPALTQLQVSRTRVTDAGLASLRTLPVQFLALDGLPLTDAGVSELIGGEILSMRHAIHVRDTNITDAGVAALRDRGYWPKVLVGGPNIKAVHLESVSFRAAGPGHAPGAAWIAGTLRIDESLAGPVVQEFRFAAFDELDPAHPRPVEHRGAVDIVGGSASHQGELKKTADGTWGFEILAEAAEFPPGTKLKFSYLTPGLARGNRGVGYEVGERAMPGR